MSRQMRARRLAARLNDLDLAVLRSLAEFRLMTGQQLARLHFTGPTSATRARRARTATKRLADWGVLIRLDRRVGGLHAGSEGHVYGLSGLGHAVLALGSPVPRRHRSAVQGKPAFFEHVLAVSELAVGLSELAHTGHCQIEELRAEPGAWRGFAGIGGGVRTLKPDAYLRLLVGEFELSAFCEIDMGTESLPTLQRKCAVYLDYYRSGEEQRSHGIFPRVWWLVADTARQESIEQVLRRLDRHECQLFATAIQTDAPMRLIQLPTLPEGGDL